MLRKLLKTGNLSLRVSLGLLLFRVGLSLMMLTHGYPKLQRVLSGHLKFGDPIGLGPEVSLILTVFAEFVCSLLLLLGLMTRYALIPLMTVMTVAWSVVHASDPFAVQEKAALFLLSFLFLFIVGPGRFSLDSKWFN